jgi:hypothetical protein
MSSPARSAAEQLRKRKAAVKQVRSMTSIAACSPRRARCSWQCPHHPAGSREGLQVRLSTLYVRHAPAPMADTPFAVLAVWWRCQWCCCTGG